MRLDSFSRQFAGCLPQHVRTAKHKRNNSFSHFFILCCCSVCFVDFAASFEMPAYEMQLKVMNWSRGLSYIMLGNVTSSREHSCFFYGCFKRLWVFFLWDLATLLAIYKKEQGCLSSRQCGVRWLQNNSVLWYIKLRVGQREERDSTIMLCLCLE